MNKKHITSHYPYLMRAMYEWMVDNGLTPYVEVEANYEGVRVPQKYVKDNTILLNIAPSAVNAFHMNNDAIEFEARFDKMIFSVFIPISAVRVVYAQEIHIGMVFYPEQFKEEGDFLTNIISPVEPVDNPNFSKRKPQKSRAKLRLVKTEGKEKSGSDSERE